MGVSDVGAGLRVRVQLAGTAVGRGMPHRGAHAQLAGP